MALGSTFQTTASLYLDLSLLHSVEFDQIPYFLFSEACLLTNTSENPPLTDFTATWQPTDKSLGPRASLAVNS